MGNKLYVGNLAYSVRDESLQETFSQFGSVTSAKVMMDRETGRSKGFGFVEMSSPAEAQAAMNAMNGQPLEGRAIVVNEARPREERPGGFGGGGGGRSGGGGYGGGGQAAAGIAQCRVRSGDGRPRPQAPAARVTLRDGRAGPMEATTSRSGRVNNDKGRPKAPY